MHELSLPRFSLSLAAGLFIAAVVALTPIATALACPTFSSCGPVMIEEDPD